MGQAGTLTLGPTQGSPGEAIGHCLCLCPSVSRSVGRSVPDSLLTHAPGQRGIGGAGQAWPGFELWIARPRARSSRGGGGARRGETRLRGRGSLSPRKCSSISVRSSWPHSKCQSKLPEHWGPAIPGTSPVEGPDRCAHAKCPTPGQVGTVWLRGSLLIRGSGRCLPLR